MFKLMRHPPLRALFVAFLLSIGIFAALVLAITSSTGQSNRVELRGVSEDALRDNGIELMQPKPDEAPTVDKNTAEQRSVEADWRVQETILLRLVIKDVEPPVDRLVWAVSIDPTTYTPQQFGSGEIAQWEQDNPGWKRGDTRALYAVSFIDAMTGEQLYFLARSATHYESPAPDNNKRP